MLGKVLITLVLLVAAFAVLTLWKAARNEARAERMHPPEGRFLDVEGTRVHAWVRGEGPDLVLIHGASGNVRDFTHGLAPRLTDRYRVIVFDRPGLGYTDRLSPTGATIVQQADLLQKAAALLGAHEPIVLGQSYGGAVALAWAVHHPDSLSALVPLAAASNPWDTGLDTYYRLTSHRWLGPLVNPLITAWATDAQIDAALASVFAPQEVPEGYDEHIGPRLTLRRASLRANALQRANLKEEIRALYPRYQAIRVPTEIVHGTADTTVGVPIHSQKLVKQIGGARLTLLPGVGHMPQHVAKDEVIAAIDRAAARAGLR